MQVFKQPGEVLTLAAPYDRLSGQGALVGAQFGVAMVDVLSTVSAPFLTEGVVTLAKTSAQAYTVGQKIYWDNTNKRCDSDGTLGMLIGVATAVAANPSSTCSLKLSDAVTMLTGPQATFAATAAAAAATAGGATPTAAQVDTGIAAAIAPLVVTINLMRTALRNAGIVL